MLDKGDPLRNYRLVFRRILQSGYDLNIVDSSVNIMNRLNCARRITSFSTPRDKIPEFHLVSNDSFRQIVHYLNESINECPNGIIVFGGRAWWLETPCTNLRRISTIPVRFLSISNDSDRFSDDRDHQKVFEYTSRCNASSIMRRYITSSHINLGFQDWASNIVIDFLHETKK